MFNTNHNAELIVTSCEYSTSSSGIDFQIRGIYEAKECALEVDSAPRIEPYLKAVQARLSLDKYTTSIAPNPREWLDSGNSKFSILRPVFISGVLPHDPECRHPIRLEVVDGQVRKPVNDPCEILEHDRLQMSDGTICYGWPMVLIDGASGREIVANPRLIGSKLESIAAAQLPVKLYGQSSDAQCSPSMVWVDQPN